LNYKTGCVYRGISFGLYRFKIIYNIIADRDLEFNSKKFGKTMKKIREKNYRPNVAAIILSSKYPEECQVMVALRNDIKNAWQFPQGGIDKDETPKEALFRELGEEIGTSEIEIIAEYPNWLSYDFPSGVAKKMYPYDGQMQKYFLVRLKPNAKVDLNTKHPEFSQYRFVSIGEVFSEVTQFKKAVYKKVIEYFRKEGYL